jgi:hypothetical protein
MSRKAYERSRNVNENMHVTEISQKLEISVGPGLAPAGPSANATAATPGDLGQAVATTPKDDCELSLNVDEIK